MMRKKNEGSRHYEQIWNKVIQQVLKVVTDECDKKFREECCLKIKPLKDWKEKLECKYRMLRKELKEICYGNHIDQGLLDGRKLAAIFCKALTEEKAYVFDTVAAYTLMKQKKAEMPPVQFNLWAVHNVYINYKLAYYVSLQLVYLTLLHDLQSSEKTKNLAKELNRNGHLYRYPPNSNSDSFDVNIIIGMARIDVSKENFDMFLFAMQLYQIEMYTITVLDKITSQQNTPISKSQGILSDKKIAYNENG